jgi:formamidopyrimidine-DNA glycosylase
VCSSDLFSAESLGAKLAGRRGPIKAALLDQRVVAGLGNIYAAEALWLARLSPHAAANSLGPKRLARLVSAIRRALANPPADRYHRTPGQVGAAAASSAREPSSDRSERWRVYDREGKRCRRCDSRVARITQAGRSTYYCPRCQRA